jgi:trimeric autotransporter adhesin
MKIPKLVILLCLFCAPWSYHCQAQSGIIKNYVCLSVPIDGNQAIDQGFDGPSSVAIDGAGGFYFSSSHKDRVYHVAKDGRLRLVVGAGVRGFSGDGGPATVARLNNPKGIAVDSGGNLYIADSDNNCIRKVTPAGIISTVAGIGDETKARITSYGDGGPATSAQLLHPNDVAVDSSGNLYIADYRTIRKVTPAGIITTIAGIGGIGPLFLGSDFNDNGSQVTSVPIMPLGIAVDSKGNLYITEQWRVRKVTLDGVITTVAGVGEFPHSIGRPVIYTGYRGEGGPATSAWITANAVAVDSFGNLYISDSYNRRIHKVTPAGIISTVAGTNQEGYSGDGGKATSAQLSNPSGVDVDSSGNIYIADLVNNRIRKVTLKDGIITTVAGNGEKSATPADISLDSADNLYIIDSANHRIHKVTPAGTIATVAESGPIDYAADLRATPLACAHGISADSAGNLYIADGCSGRIRRITPAGVMTSVIARGQEYPNSIGQPPAREPTPIFSDPDDVAVDSGNNLYFVSRLGIQIVTPDGSATTIAKNNIPQIAVGGFKGGPAYSNQLYRPWTIVVDSAGTLYVADRDDNRIKQITPDGAVTTVAGNGTKGYSGDGGKATFAQLSSPIDVAVDSAGNLYISDSGNKCIRKVIPNGMITTVAGNGGEGSDGDGGPATTAQLTPSHIAVDSAGNLFVVDSRGGCIRKVTFSSR